MYSSYYNEDDDAANDPWSTQNTSSSSSAITAGGLLSPSASGPIFSSSPSAPTTSPLAGLLDERALPAVYEEAWRTALSSSSTSGGFGTSVFTSASRQHVPLSVLLQVLARAAALSASETEKVGSPCYSVCLGKGGVYD